ncbi:hypothetical protein BDF14DRAFT_1802834 [Spinellus fusiger]|nr:hypothetical protein BDF14DRAFT_1802834 [Spinellus fusiger]
MFFLCTSNKLLAIEMLLELMFDVEFGESVLVVGVLHLIMADNPMHAAVACSLGGSANLPCRKCFWRKGSGSAVVDGAPARRREELVEMCQQYNNNPNNSSPRSNPSTGYKLTGGEALLSLQL